MVGGGVPAPLLLMVPQKRRKCEKEMNRKQSPFPWEREVTGCQWDGGLDPPVKGGTQIRP